MFGLGLLLVLATFSGLLYWATRFFNGWKSKVGFVFVVLGVLTGYPFAYKLSSSYSKFLELCDSPTRYQVLRTRTVDYIFLDRNTGSDCKAGPKYIESLPFAGFDCIAPNTRTTTAVFRYTKKKDWKKGCGLECFESNVQGVPEAKYERGHRQGYIEGITTTVTYDQTGFRGHESTGNKLRFIDTLLLDTGTEMAFTRNYIYYPYGSGWATILGAASGSAPSFYCKVPFVSWDLRDIYKARGGA